MHDAQGDSVPLDLQALAQHAATLGPIWAYQGEDLNVTVLRFASGDGVAEHVNSEVDVLMIGVLGEGTVRVEDETHCVAAGTALIVPKGRRRSIRADSGAFVYLSCHRRRAGLWPTRLPPKR